MDVLILAGGRTDAALKAASGADWRALVPFDGRPMVDIVLEAVQHLGEPILVADFERAGVRSVAAGKGFVESLSHGLDAVQSDHFLLATSDIPFVTREAVDDFLQRSDQSVLLNYPIISADAADAKFPGIKRTTLKLKEGVFTGGNIAYMKTDLMRGALPHLKKGYENRKSPLKLGAQVGWSTLFAVILSKTVPSAVSVKSLESKVGRFLGGPIKAIHTPFAELGVDIDDAEQYAAMTAKKL